MHRKLSNIELRAGTPKAEIVPITALLHRHTSGESVGALPCEGSMMQKSYFLPDNVSAHIHRPACPKCGAFMMLARIVPARVGFDFRTFECPQCDHVHEVMVATEAFGRSFAPPP
jgi:hypothetical protein